MRNDALIAVVFLLVCLNVIYVAVVSYTEQLKSFLKIGAVVLLALFGSSLLMVLVHYVNKCSECMNIMTTIFMVTIYNVCIFRFALQWISVPPGDFILMKALCDSILALVVLKMDTAILLVLPLSFNIIAHATRKMHWGIRMAINTIPLLFFLFPFDCFLRITLPFAIDSDGFIMSSIPLLLMFIETTHASLIAASINTKEDEKDSPNSAASKDEYVDFDRLSSSDASIAPKEGRMVILTKFLKFVEALIALVFLLALVLMPQPYNEMYPLRGSFAQFIHEDMSSEVYFAPIVGQHGVDFLGSVFKKKFEYQKINNFETIMIRRPAIVVHKKSVELPSFIKKWPSINVTSFEGEFRRVFITLEDNDDGMDAIGIRVKHNGDHIMRVFNHTELPNFDFGSDGFRYVMVKRIQPVFAPLTFTVDLNGTEKVNAELFLHWDRHSEDLLEFEKHFPAYVTQTEKVAVVQDTLLILKIVL